MTFNSIQTENEVNESDVLRKKRRGKSSVLNRQKLSTELMFFSLLSISRVIHLIRGPPFVACLGLYLMA